MIIPYFSIVIPTLNEALYLPRLLTNLNQQTYLEFEVFVVDGRSTDTTRQLVRQFSAQYPLTLLVTSKRNVSYQRNLGAHKARGKVLIFFDADTQIPKNYLDRIREAFEIKKPHCLTTYMKSDSSDPAASAIASFSNMIFEIGKVIKAPSLYGAMMAIKRSAFEDIGGFDEQAVFGEDSELFQRAMQFNYKYSILPQPKYVFSLRRYRSEGTLDTILQYIRLNLSKTVKGLHADHPSYPMGGHVHKIKIRTKSPDLIRRFDLLLDKLNQAPKEQSDKAREFFKQLFLPKSPES